MTNYIVVPIFNEEKRISRKYFEEITNNNDIKILFVNDGSTDNTKHILLDLLKSIPGEQIDLPKNKGKAEAIRIGVNRILSFNDAKSISFLDADGAFDAWEVVEKINLFAGGFVPCNDQINCLNKIHFASRIKIAGSHISRSNKRHYLNRIIMTYLCFGNDLFPYDSQAGFKVFPSCLHTYSLFERDFATKWFFDLEIFIRAISKSKSDLPVVEFPVSYWTEVPGSKILTNGVFEIIKEILKIKKIIKTLNSSE